MDNRQQDSKEEQELLHQVSQGQREGYVGVMKKYGPQVMGLVCRMVSESMDAEELVQDTFVKAFSHIHTFQPEKASLKTWLLHIAYNESVNHLRKRRPESVHLEQWMEDRQIAYKDRKYDGENNEDYFAWNDSMDTDLIVDTDCTLNTTFCTGSQLRIQLLEEAIELLHPQERTLLTLYYYDNLSLQEISQILGVKNSIISTRLFRIRHKLHDMIKKKSKV